MKAKIVPKKEKVLLYRCEQNEKLKAILDEMDIEIRMVQESELTLTVGELADGKTAGDGKAAPETIPDFPAMAMANLTEKHFNRLLDTMKAIGIDLPIKMVVTPHNREWQFDKLLFEVKAEHEKMTSRA